MSDKKTHVPPLKKRTMTLSQLQLATLNLIRKLRFQLNRVGYEEGMSDKEFLEQIVYPLEADIYQDRKMIALQRHKKTENGKE